MDVIRNLNEELISLYEGNEKLVEFNFCGDDLSIVLFTDQDVIIDRAVDPILVDNFYSLIDNNYLFSDSHSISSDNQIVWLSDFYKENISKNQIDDINRLTIERNINSDKLKLKASNPYFEENGWKKNYNLILFSLCGNGKETKNIDTDDSFQNDMVKMFYYTLEEKRLNDNLSRKRSVK